jgi:hypothetical protein
MWTSLSCVLCLFCAKNPQNRSVYSESVCVCMAACLLWVAAEAGRPLIMPIRLFRLCRRHSGLICAGADVLHGRAAPVQDTELEDGAATDDCGRCTIALQAFSDE